MRYEIEGDNATLQDVMGDLRKTGAEPVLKSKRRVGRTRIFRCVVVTRENAAKEKRRQLHLFDEDGE